MIINLLFALIIFQDFIGIFLFNIGVPIAFIKILLATKDILLIIIIIKSCIDRIILRKNIHINGRIILLLMYFIIVTSYLFIFPEANNNINDYRSLIYPTYAYIAGFVIMKMSIAKIMKTIKNMTILSVAVSIISYLPGKELFINIKTLPYIEYVRGYIGMTSDNLPSTFFGKFSNLSFFRLPGPTLNPLGSATLYSLIFLIYYYAYNRKEEKSFRFYLIFILIAIFLTFSRGPIFCLIIGLIISNIIMSRKKSYKNKKVVIIYVIIAIIIGYTFIKYNSLYSDTINIRDYSTKTHIIALQGSYEYVKYNFLGTGIGGFSKWNINMTMEAIGENSYALIIGQVGIISCILLLIIYINIMYKLYKNKFIPINCGLFAFIIASLINGMFSASLLSVTPQILFWILAGYSDGHLMNREQTFRQIYSVKKMDILHRI
jgi:hypothetical protein